MTKESIKTATTISEQINKLKNRGLQFHDEKKAYENLLDIGYYRLGFYLFPFEKTYPRKVKRDHQYKEGSVFEEAIQLYYFDFDMRNILLRYISRVEINFRTKLIYFASNKFKDNPFWYTDALKFKKGFVEKDDYQRALHDVSKEDVIKFDIKSHPSHKHAPAWKAIEYMQFGTIITIYENLLDGEVKMQVAKACSVDSPTRLLNYMNTVRRLRNCCAHGKVLYDLNLSVAISTGGPVKLSNSTKSMLSGACDVLKYLLSSVSKNRAKDMTDNINDAYNIIGSEKVKQIIRDNSGLIF